ncbi:MAG: hypothetical protein R3279_02345, partial [Putridiphycobacter sp.]|nr:hypothetical protein [Putridiphycobacter sp.]
TQSVTAIIQIVLAFQLFKFRVDWTIFARILVFTVIIVAINSSWFIHLSGLGGTSKNAQLLSIFLLGILLILVLRFINIKEMIQLLKPQKSG